MRELAQNTKRAGGCFYDALAKPGISVIGEFKKASPSHGRMEDKIDILCRMEQYNAAVDAISVLTEEDYFYGSIEDLRQIRSMTALPILRKDFIIDAYQVYEARAAGADAVLLIAAILDDTQFKKLYELAYSLSLDVLCEVHDEEELARMTELGVKIIGINNRNLKSFHIDFSTTERLAAKLKHRDGTLLVAESGIHTDNDMRTLQQSGVNAVLIGTALMESENPGKLAAHWKKIYDRMEEQR